MIPRHNIYQIYHSSSVRDDCTPPKCGELSLYTDSAHTEVELNLGRFCQNSIWRPVHPFSISALDITVISVLEPASTRALANDSASETMFCLVKIRGWTINLTVPPNALLGPLPCDKFSLNHGNSICNLQA